MVTGKRTPEQIVKTAICYWLWQNKYFFWMQANTGTWDPKRKLFRKKNSRWERKGIADILGTTPDGRLLAIEVKAPTSYRVTPEQKLFLADVKSRGGTAFIARSVEDVEKHLPAFRQNQGGYSGPCLIPAKSD